MLCFIMWYMNFFSLLFSIITHMHTHLLLSRLQLLCGYCSLMEELHHRGLHDLPARFRLCVWHGLWVHFENLIILFMLAMFSLTQQTTLFSTAHSFATFYSSSAKFSEVFLSLNSKQSRRWGTIFQFLV